MVKNNSDIKNVSIRIPENILKELHYVSNYEGRSMNKQVVFLIRQCISKFKQEHGEIDIS